MNNMATEVIQTLFDEISLAARWKKPAFVIAIYRQVDQQMQAAQELEEKLIRDGYTVHPVHTDKTHLSDFLELAQKSSQDDRAVYYVVDPPSNQNQSSANEWQAFYAQQQGITSHPLRTVLWLHEETVKKLVLQSSAFWENRHQVIDLITCYEHPVDNIQINAEPEDLAHVLFHQIQENLNIGIDEWRQNDLERACQYLQNACDLADVLNNTILQVQCRDAQALVFLDMQRFQEAIDVYNNILDIDPDATLPWRNIGHLYVEIHELKQAEQAFKNALRHDPHDATAWIGLATVFQAHGQFKEALHAYHQATKSPITSAQAWVQIGKLLERMEQADKAIKAYKAALDANSSYTEAWCRMAIVQHEQKKHDEAEQHIRKAMEQASATVETWMLLANIAKNYDPAIVAEAYTKALIIDPYNGHAYCELAKAHANLGKFTDAIRCYEMGMNFLENDVERAQAWKALLSILWSQETIEKELAGPSPEKIKTDAPQMPEPVHPSTLKQVLDISTASTAHEAKVTSKFVEVDTEIFLHNRDQSTSFEAFHFDRLEQTSYGDSSTLPIWCWNKEHLEKERHTIIGSGLHIHRTDHELVNILLDAKSEQVHADHWQSHARHIAKNAEDGSYKDVQKSTSYYQEQKNKASGTRAWARQGKTMLNRGLYNEAAEAFSLAIQFAPEQASLYIDLGKTYFLQAEYDLAREQFNLALELTNDPGEKALAWNYIGDIYRRQHDKTKAVDAYQKATKTGTQSALRERTRQALALGNC